MSDIEHPERRSDLPPATRGRLEPEEDVIDPLAVLLARPGVEERMERGGILHPDIPTDLRDGLPLDDESIIGEELPRE